MGVSVGWTRVCVVGTGVDVGELQEDNRNRTVMKERKRCMSRLYDEMGRISYPIQSAIPSLMNL
jgi:hypothetical protein